RDDASARTTFGHFTARLAAATTPRRALPSVISPLASPRDALRLALPSVISPLASSPRRRLGSHYLRSFHRSPRPRDDASARTTFGHFTARLAAATTPRLALPSVISPLASSPRRRLGSHYHPSASAIRRLCQRGSPRYAKS